MKSQSVIWLLAICYAVVGWLGGQLWQVSYDRPGLLWLHSGIGLLLLLQHGKWRFTSLFVAGFCAYLLNFYGYSDNLARNAIGAAIFTGFDLVLLAMVLFAFNRLKKSLPHPMFTRNDDIARYFLIVCLIPPISVNVIKTSLFGQFYGQSHMLMSVWGALGDIVSLLIFVPIIFWNKQDKEYSPTVSSLAIAAGLLSLPIFASIISHVSLVFLSFPLALVVAMRLGFNGAVLTSLMLTVVSLTSYIVNGVNSPFKELADVWIYLLSFALTSHFIAQAVIELKRNKASLQRLVEKRTEALRETNQQLELLATTDELTGAVNRRQFNQLAKYALNSASRYQEPLSILALDIDHFKRINDNHGHDIGDVALKHFAGICQVLLRSSDTFARIGGEEFVILLPRTRFLAAKLVAEKICKKVEETPFTPTRHLELSITVSIGVAEWQSHESDIKSTLKRADVALYEAKSSGRNQVVLSKPSAVTS